MKRLLEKCKRIISSRYFPLILGLFAIILTIPSIHKGLAADDFFISVSRNFPVPSAPKGIFAISTNKRNLSTVLFHKYIVVTSAYKEILERGDLPWWTSENLSFSFLRPVSAFTGWLDLLLWPNSPPLMHLQNIFWYVILSLTAFIFYKKFSPTVFSAGLAALLFTIDINHLTPIVWIADRCRILVLLFGILTLIFHNVWRKKKKTSYLWIALLTFLLTLFSSEASIGVVGYLIAYALILENSNFFKKITTVLPYFLTLIIWNLIYRLLGFGIAGTSLYTDPLKDPVSFSVQFFIRTPILFIEQWFNTNSLVPPKLWGFFGPALFNLSSPSVRTVFVVTSYFAMAIVLFFLWKIVRKNKVGRFWILGMMLSLGLASLTNILNGRLLLFAGIGMFGLLAMLTENTLNQLKKKKLKFFPTFFLLVLLTIHGIISPLQLFWYSGGPNQWQQNINRFVEINNNGNLSKKIIVFVNVPSSQYLGLFYFIRRYQKKPLPKKIFMLTHGYYDITLKRIDEKTVQTKSSNKFPERARNTLFNIAYLNHDIDKVFYKLPLDLKNNDFTRGGVLIRILKKDQDGFPTVVNFIFKQRLEDAENIWYQWNWRKEKYEEFILPKVGETVEIKAPF